MKIDTSVALKAGLIGAAAGLVVGILNTFLCGLLCWLGLIVSLAVGALYVHFAGRTVEIGEGALGGGLSGAISGGIGGLITGILGLIFGAAAAGAGLLGGEVETAVEAAGYGIINFIQDVGGGLVSGAVLGAIGGLIWAAIKGRQ